MRLWLLKRIARWMGLELQAYGETKRVISVVVFATNADAAAEMMRTVYEGGEYEIEMDGRVH